MTELKALTYEKNIAIRKKILALTKKQEEKTLHDLSLRTVFYGLRGLPLLYSPTSLVKPEKGVFYQGVFILDLIKQLPCFGDSQIPSAEALFWFLLSGDIPTKEQVEGLRLELLQQSSLPSSVYTAIDSLPENSNPMTRLCTALLSLSSTSIFVKKYDEGLDRNAYWEHCYDDALSLIAKLNSIVAYIYKNYCVSGGSAGAGGAGSSGGTQGAIDPSLDWTGNLSQLMGIEDSLSVDLIRLFIFTHADHGPSNASAHTCHLVGSTLSNAFYTSVASMTALAGPLHGHANEDTFKWLLRLLAKTEKAGDSSDAFVSECIQGELDSGQRIPGYGHAALRVEDPRFTLIRNFLVQNKLESKYISLANAVYRIAPDLLKKQGKISSPHPNIDAITGTSLYSLGIKEFDFYTVLFGASRIFGVMAQHIIDRVLQIPIERPAAFNLDNFIRGLETDPSTPETP